MSRGLTLVHISLCRLADSVKVTINGYTCSTVGNRGGQQYIVVNADARRNAAVEVADVIPIFAGEKR